MNKEINTIIANLEGCIGMFDYLLTPTESNLLVSYIEELQQENKQLKEIIKENTILVKDEYGDYQECNINPLGMKQKYEKQVDNWNKLKKYIKETKLKEFEKSYGKRYGKTFTQAEIIVCNMILNKMQELQGSNNDE